MTPLAQTELAALAQACLDQLHREEAFLRTFAESLAELHAALRFGDVAAVQVAAAHHAEFADRSDMIDRTRRAFRRTAATALGMPVANANIGQIAAMMPNPWSEQIRHAQRQLWALAEQTRSQARRTAGVLRCCQSFTRALLADVCGRQEKVDRYGPSGAVFSDVPTGAVTGVL